jgi:hypothetical protein
MLFAEIGTLETEQYSLMQKTWEILEYYTRHLSQTFERRGFDSLSDAFPYQTWASEGVGVRGVVAPTRMRHRRPDGANFEDVYRFKIFGRVQLNFL